MGINVGYIFFAMPITYPAGFLASKIFGGVGGYTFFCAISALDTGVYCWGELLLMGNADQQDAAAMGRQAAHWGLFALETPGRFTWGRGRVEHAMYRTR